MPRSPSPPRYRQREYDDRRFDRDRGPSTYRDRPFQAQRSREEPYRERDRERDWDTYSRNDDGRGRGHWQDERDDRGYGSGSRYRRGRSPSRSRSRSRSRERQVYRRNDDRDREPLRDSRAMSPAKPKAPSTRSGSPEEGQITASPLRRPSPVRATSPRRGAGLVPGTPPWKRRERERERGWVDRDRDRPRVGPSDRELDTARRRPFGARSPREAERIGDERERDKAYSPATSSRSRSSRFSPDRRPRRPSPSPERRRTPERQRSPQKRPRMSFSPERRGPYSDSRPNTAGSHTQSGIQVSTPLPGTPESAATGRTTARPPSGPRSDRLPPTGPASLAIPLGPRALATPAASPYAHPPSVPVRAAPPIRADAVSTPSPTAQRLSWSERKAGKAESPIGVKHETRVDEEGERDRQSSVAEVPALSEQELEEQRLKEEDRRIMSELPALKMPFGTGQWELDLENHYKRMSTLQHHTNRAQSAHRIAGAILADAEAERLAASERKRITEGQLMAGSLGIISGV